MAEGKGDTPEAQEAYQEYAKAKTCYESRLSGDSGGTSGFATIKDWDESGDSFSFSLGEVCSGCWHEALDSDFFIADRGEDSIIHVFDSPGIIDMGNIPLDDIKEAPASGYVEMATPIMGHSYVVRSKGKYGKFYIDETYDWLDPTEYGIEWVYQPDGTRSFGGGGAPTPTPTPTVTHSRFSGTWKVEFNGTTYTFTFLWNMEGRIQWYHLYSRRSIRGERLLGPNSNTAG
jgi:hypothetical protein